MNLKFLSIPAKDMRQKNTTGPGRASSPTSIYEEKFLSCFGGGSSTDSKKGGLPSAVRPYLQDGRTGRFGTLLLPFVGTSPLGHQI